MGTDDVVVQIQSRELYSMIEEFERVEVRVETKYKTLDKKVKPVAAPLPEDAKSQVERASRERSLRDVRKMRHKFSDDTLGELRIGIDNSLLPEEVACFKQMLAKHGKAFAFDPDEIDCVDLSVVTPMVIFTVPHVPWDLRPIPVPRAYLPKLMDLLKEKMRMRILEPSFAPYSSRWFTVPKKSGSLKFIQDMQPVNAVTIRNVGVDPIVDEFAEAFAGKAIYSMGDLYSRKGARFKWVEKHAEAMRKMKKLLSSSTFLKQIVYRCGRPVILTTDTSPIAIKWAVGQDDAKGDRFTTRFGARVLSTRQRSYPHVKKEQWGLVTAMKTEKEYLIGAEVVIETDFLPMSGMIANCMSIDMAMLNLIAYIKTLNPEFWYIAGKDNPVADMLSRVRYEGEEDMIDDTDDIGRKFYSASQVEGDVEVGFKKELYDGEWLDLGKYLGSLEMQEGWSNAEFSRISKRSYDYMLQDGYLWKRPKHVGGEP
ncbi:hypothetical protein R1sor_000758 [Riccia sorocarpa]|uniref:Reverse transcriptase/retrotransposon-derived protein RNase H-like domain-containing protein n=1 Tax=Riccia sorocarpa TaxID=122646 RepID=A0ABD3GY73_9MARC